MTFRLTSLLVATIAALSLATVQAQTPHNLILFVPAGLRASSVTPDHGPAMAAVHDKGVNFANSHSLFPTFTMANASGMPTGHFLGDTGVLSNTIYVGFPVPHAADASKPDAVVAANGDSDLVYIPGKDHALTAKVVSTAAGAGLRQRCVR